MKVVFITALYAPNEKGGAERTVRTLAECLVRYGHAAVVISLAPDGTAASGEVNGVRTYYVPLRNIFWLHSGKKRFSSWSRGIWHLIDAYNPAMRAAVARILALENPDVVQTGNLQGFSVSIWSAAHRLNIPIVQMLHDYYLACPNSSMFNNEGNCRTQCRLCRAYTLPRRLLSNRPAAVIGLSKRILQRLAECGLFSTVACKTVIHGANNFMPTELAPRANKLPHESLTVGYLGRIERTKGIEVLLRAVQCAEMDGLKLLVAGDGHADYVAALKAKFPFENVKFLGSVTPAELFKQIDLLVVPSLWEEPLGRVIYEAYAHGIPAAVSRLGGMPEIVEDGVTGFVFAPGEHRQLADILRSETAIGWRGAQYAQACLRKSGEFDVTHLFNRYLDVWQAAAHGAVAGGAMQRECWSSIEPRLPQ